VSEFDNTDLGLQGIMAICWIKRNVILTIIIMLDFTFFMASEKKDRLLHGILPDLSCHFP